MDNRLSWDEYFMQMTELISQRSTCVRRKVGAVITVDNRIISTGYNGVPCGISHCSSVGCVREEKGIPSGTMHELCRGLHAEQNAIVSAANYGGSLKGGTIYVNTKPCVICLKMIINAGIKRVVYDNGYPDPLSDKMIEESGIICEQKKSL